MSYMKSDYSLALTAYFDLIATILTLIVILLLDDYKNLKHFNFLIIEL